MKAVGVKAVTGIVEGATEVVTTVAEATGVRMMTGAERVMAMVAVDRAPARRRPRA